MKQFLFSILVICSSWFWLLPVWGSPTCEFLGSYTLPQQMFQNTPVGGLSGIFYDRQRQKYYLLSDDRSEKAPARFYTAGITIAGQVPQIEKVTIEEVTFLKQQDGTPFPVGSIDPEDIALSPQRTLWISSEGVSRDGIPAFVAEFSLFGGKWQRELLLRKRYFPAKGKGIRDNLGFESITIPQSTPGDPYRLFTAVESALAQDQSKEVGNRRVRFLHYVINGSQQLNIAEHLYLLDPPPLVGDNTLTALLATAQPGQFLSLERSVTPLGTWGAKLFVIYTGRAQDISGIDSLSSNVGSVKPIEKTLLLDLNTLGVQLDNLEGITYGPRLADGSQSLILVSDNNFSGSQVNQFLLFRISF